MGFLNELGYKQDIYMIYCDSQNTIHLTKNASFHSVSKYIDGRCH